MVEEDVGRERATPSEQQTLKPHPLTTTHVQVVIVIVVRECGTLDDDLPHSCVATGPDGEISCQEYSEAAGEVIDPGGQLENEVGGRGVAIVEGTGRVTGLVPEDSVECLTWSSVWRWREMVVLGSFSLYLAIVVYITNTALVSPSSFFTVGV